ncbi:hypothetical protein [Altererythrobacter sp. GH1-8]|uniref:hypothetical protein n=1 Tax=Altererythrobacter sp. GH1-8 TaxID=3349333 RepID=UPI00374DEC0D
MLQALNELRGARLANKREAVLIHVARGLLCRKEQKSFAERREKLEFSVNSAVQPHIDGILPCFRLLARVSFLKVLTG